MTEISNLGRNIGYARVSKEEQHLGLQLDALKKHGVIRVFMDKQTGTRFDRKEFLAALAYLNEGDTLVVWKLDRLGRSFKELIETVENLQKRNIALVSLTEHIDTPGGCSHGIWWINRSALSKPPSGCFSSVVSPDRLPHLGVRLYASAAASTFTNLL